MKNLFLIALIFTSIYTAKAQQNWCGTDAYNQQLLDNLSIKEAEEAINRRENSFIQGRLNKSEALDSIIVVPVVIHVLHDDCNGNISKAQILDGMRIINEDFKRINSDTAQTRALFKPFAGNPRIEFRLAQIDPDGACTEGIVRVNNEVTNDFPYNNPTTAKAISHWPSDEYFNIWLVNSIEGGSILGYAQFPWMSPTSNYGFVAKNNTWGTIGTSNSDGRTATHEIGHCLGLLHTFQSSCAANRDCDKGGDYLCDTPPAYQATWSCSKSQNSCTNDTRGPSPYTSNVVDQIENYMSYDNCQNMFTLEQKDQMRGSLTNPQYAYLNRLISQSNLNATGTNDGYIAQVCKPRAQFCQGEVSMCAGNSIKYTDLSYEGPVGSRTWNFPGGTPSTSTDSIVDVFYNTPGVYSVSMSVSNAFGNTTMTKNKLITVYSSEADLDSWRYRENFENKDFFDTAWVVVNEGGGKKWELTDLAAYAGDNSVYISNNINSVGSVSELISPSYNLSSIIAPKMTFREAFARKSSSNEDKLVVYATFNCGNSWSLLTVLPSVLLESTSGFTSSNFIPVKEEWKMFQINLNSFISTQENVRFKFEFTAGGGNNIFIDDILIESATGIEDQDTGLKFKIYPNPASKNLFVQFENELSLVQELTIRDVSGRTMKRLTAQELNTMNGNSVEIDVSAFTPGIYILQMNGKEAMPAIRKFVVQ